MTTADDVFCVLKGFEAESLYCNTSSLFEVRRREVLLCDNFCWGGIKGLSKSHVKDATVKGLAFVKNVILLAVILFLW